MPWIHLHDHVEMIAAALSDARYRGPVNATAPHPVTNADFARQLGRTLRRPTLVPLPAFALKAALGESSSVLLASQRAVPHKATSLGFAYQFPNLAGALGDIIEETQRVDIGLAART
jgi:NAD dependent epimerase/dehydratase family enzyme